MSRHLKQYEKEHMKMAMLKQEETFKQQVQELHRLYRVQKLMMTTAGSATAMPAAIRCTPEDEHHAEEENEAGSSQAYAASERQAAAAATAVVDESELELTLAIGTTTTKKEAPSSSVDSRTSNSSSSTESGSPQFGATTMAPHRPSRLRSSSSSVKVVGAGTTTTQQRLDMEQDALKHPPWLHQCLNLAR
ncbi:uncharacterized protein LOC102707568 [Oryza brachyantha]|uniref:uncharacterized protein LOC102707568 n=1 Tax=Oryza brachyantha TaxID=4533 RepID=UPI001ADB780D|nr:uncharacterized protein LOC102707568 [Oryza brachyantha]